MGLKRKDLLTLQELGAEEILHILDTAASFKEVVQRPIKKVPALRGKTVVNLFFEPSTRTRTSFELAAKRLSADVVNFTAGSSSLVKGESLLDTVRNIEAMNVHTIIMRHSCSGAVHLVARHCRVGVVNAGDGTHAHPTQGLLDLFTIREVKKSFAGLTVTLVGDITHSRVARSNIHGLLALGAKVRVVGPATLIPKSIAQLGVEIHYRLEEAIAGADVINILRIQLERQDGQYFPSAREYAHLYGVNARRLKLAKPDVLIMHPGPMNRGIEISPRVADGPNSVILNQVTNGVAVRMAVLYLLSGGESDENPD
ncbi:aspartate carbamoyltransferase catalytic subunit [candidate division FCPU426 bacterium]|nr:aspartate carbamoyltransferase catalytic subunit [candidate division FCPU426 bacterium]